MTRDREFLAGLMAGPWKPEARHGFQAAGLFVGKGANVIEVAVARAGEVPSRTALFDSWKARRAGRAAPILLASFARAARDFAARRAKRHPSIRT